MRLQQDQFELQPWDLATRVIQINLTPNENLLGNCYLHPFPPPHIDAPLIPSEAYSHQGVSFQQITYFQGWDCLSPF